MVLLLETKSAAHSPAVEDLCAGMPRSRSTPGGAVSVATFRWPLLKSGPVASDGSCAPALEQDRIAASTAASLARIFPRGIRISTRSLLQDPSSGLRTGHRVFAIHRSCPDSCGGSPSPAT